MPRRQLSVTVITRERAARQRLGRRLRRARERQGLLQKAVASRVGLPTYKTVSLIEQGAVNVPPRVIGPLEATLGLRPGTILFEEMRWRLIRQGFGPGRVNRLIRAARDRAGR